MPTGNTTGIGTNSDGVDHVLSSPPLLCFTSDVIAAKRGSHVYANPTTTSGGNGLGNGNGIGIGMEMGMGTSAGTFGINSLSASYRLDSSARLFRPSANARFSDADSHTGPNTVPSFVVSGSILVSPSFLVADTQGATGNGNSSQSAIEADAAAIHGMPQRSEEAELQHALIRHLNPSLHSDYPIEIEPAKTSAEVHGPPRSGGSFEDNPQGGEGEGEGNDAGGTGGQQLEHIEQMPNALHICHMSALEAALAENVVLCTENAAGGDGAADTDSEIKNETETETEIETVFRGLWQSRRESGRFYPNRILLEILFMLQRAMFVC